MTEGLETHLQRQIEHSGRFFWHRLRWRAVREYLPDDSSFELIDVGAGAGLLGEYLARDRPRATYRFVEPIDSLRTRLRQEYGAGADADDNSSYQSARFVTLLDVLEHQEKDHEFMQGLVAKMVPGSMLILTVPALQRLWSSWDTALGHFRRYDKQTLLDCVDGLPLRVNEASYLFPEMVPFSVVRSRRTAPEPDSAAAEKAEFPDLPRVVNDVLYGLGTASLGLRSHWKRGTSLFLSATITG